MSSFDPTTPLIAVGVFVAIFSFCCYTSILRRRSSAEDDHDELSTRPFDVGTSNGLDANIIEKFPTFIYSEVKHLTIGKGALECAVCLNEFEDDEVLKLLPKCDHVFHSECIGKWLSSRTTCPVCRDDLGKLDAQELEPIDGGSVTIEVAEEDIVDDGGLKKSTNRSKFPRSHSTGHSLVQQGESVDRFTLNLPVQIRIRNEIMTRTLNQTMSLKEGVKEAAAGGGGDGEGSGGRVRSYRRLGSLDRPDRWMFYMALPVKLSKSNRFVVLGKNNESSLPV